MTTQDIVQKLWNLCDVLRDDGIRGMRRRPTSSYVPPYGFINNRRSPIAFIVTKHKKLLLP